MAFPRTLCGLAAWAIAIAAIRPTSSKVFVDPMQHDLQVVNAKTFTTNVQLARQTTVVGALFYSTPDSNLAHIVDEMNALAKDLKGVVNVVAVNCSDHALKSLCKQELGEDYGTPVFKVYPRLPAPPRSFEVSARTLAEKIRQGRAQTRAAEAPALERVQDRGGHAHDLHGLARTAAQGAAILGQGAPLVRIQGAQQRVPRGFQRTRRKNSCSGSSTSTSTRT